jgi:Flp pilus assembly protein TadD
VSKLRPLVFIILSQGLFGAGAGDATLGGTVSVEELRNPLGGKSLRMLLDVRRDLRSGHKDRAMETLRQAMADPVARPYAVSMLGVEHLKDGQVDIAIGELEEAVRLLPAHAEIHSDLAFALGVKDDYEHALAEARKASQLDPAGAKTRYVLGRVLMLRPETRDEGVAHLKMIAGEVPAAHQALAAYYAWKGQPEAAEREKQAYQGSSDPVAGALGFQASH